jgi:hypothetical protein
LPAAGDLAAKHGGQARQLNAVVRTNIPESTNEDQPREFRSTHDAADHADRSRAATVAPGECLWKAHTMALDDVTDRLHRIARALGEKSVPYALVGGQAVAIWVATKEPAAVRTTKDVDILIRRDDLPQARAAALSVEMDYFEVLGVGMFLDRSDPNPRHAVHLVWAGEKVRPDYELPSPAIEQRQTIAGIQAVSLPGLVLMKLMSNRDQDRVHLRDMIDVGLVGRDILSRLPPSLAGRLETLLAESGR